MKNKAIIFLAFVAMAVSCSSSAHNNTRLNQSASMSDGTWVFTAERMLPKYGRSNTVIGGYNVTFDPHKLVVYLPYTGRAYAGAGYPGEGNPLGFTSKEFKENRQEGKKGRLIITIEPKDYPEVQTMIFTFFDNGNATLDITLANRSGISFTGRVEPIQ